MTQNLRFWSRLLLLVFLLRPAPGVSALSAFYREQPRLFSPDGESSGGSFPVTALNGSIAALAWQEEAGSGENDDGQIATHTLLRGSAGVSLAPRIFRREGGGYLLFAAQGAGQPLSIYCACSDDGLSWTAFEPFVEDRSLRLNVLPTHAALGGIDYVVFQSFVGSVDVAPTFQRRELLVFWQNQVLDGNPIYSLVPDTTAAAPRLAAENFVPSRRSPSDRVRFSWDVPEDPSGVLGFSCLWSRSPDALPPRQITASAEITSREEIAREDGSWYFSVMAQDGGAVSRVFLEREDPPPYEREYFLEKGDYRVVSDREISGLRINDIEQGTYRIGVEHPLRGIARSAPVVSPDNLGTLQFGDFSRPREPEWARSGEGRRRINIAVLIIIGTVLLCGTGIAASVWGIAAVLADNAAIQAEMAALITGDLMPLEKKKHLNAARRRRIGLRLKLASFTIALVLLVVVMVSCPLYLLMTRTQEETLLQSLRDRAAVLMDGIASSVRAYLPSGNVLEMGFLPAHMAAIPEARYVSITGYGSSNATFADILWATNDPDILSKIDTIDFEPGVSRLEDALSPRIEQLAADLNKRAGAEVGNLNAGIASLTQEALALSLLDDPESVRQFENIQETTRGLEIRLTDRLNSIARELRSEPRFPTQRLDASAGAAFMFYKPVMFRQGSEDRYFRGLIRLEVSIDSIIEQISERQRSLLRVLMIVALTAIAIGAAGALALSALIIRPIKRLVSHVERIRDTDNKTKLEGVEINLKTMDELDVLGNTINDMTRGLVMAAKASEDLVIGKEVQKKFIPLEIDREGNKLTTGFKDTGNAQFFGYYEGAKGVSGDYFDYLDLDGRYFAVIKCDVAGKGVPAALIMIQVATMFLNYFKSWKSAQKNMHIEEAVYQINDFIETLGFKGRFAAFTLALFDSETGLIRFCNAGDNIVHLYDSSERKMKTVTLPQTPATGALPNLLVESRGGYQVQTITLGRGDMLLLYTDGIEEAKRKFRNSLFQEIICPGGPEIAPAGTPHGNHIAGQGDEEMGADRVEAIVNAAMNKQQYSLYKYHNPEGEIALQFDFSSCAGTAEDAIMALVSVEKMFRLYRDPSAGGDSRVLVDKKIDRFLKKHFRQYRTYCAQTQEAPGSEAYRYYTHVKEDEQYDDLTILGIHRK